MYPVILQRNYNREIKLLKLKANYNYVRSSALAKIL